MKNRGIYSTEIRALSVAALALLALFVWLARGADKAWAQANSGPSVSVLEAVDANTTASGNTASLSIGVNGSCAAAAELKTLTGGTTPDVTFTLQTSSDNAAWYTVNAFAACTAACTKTDFTRRTFFRFVRVKWVTTGAPTGSTSSFFINCFR